MTPVTLSTAQSQAVNAPHHVVVRAAAGSGKTRVLIERYLHLLQREPERRPADLLAITFTNRAAAEMRRRLRERLSEIQREGETEAEREQAAACLEGFHHAAVMTIHSFAVEILRSHPFEAGLDPEFGISDELAAANARDDVVEQMLQDIGALPERDGLRLAAVRLLRTWGHDSTARALLRLLSADRPTESELDVVARRSPIDLLATARTHWESWAREKFEVLAKDAELIRRGGDAAQRRQDAEGPLPVDRWPDAARDLFDETLTLARRAEALETLFENTLTGDRKSARKGLHHATHGKKADWSAIDWETLGEVIPALGEALLPICETWIPWNENREREVAQLVAALATLGMRARAELSSRKDQEGWLDFGDQLREAARLVREQPARVAKTLADRFSGVLIDEFQDTDPAQWELAESLLRAAEESLPILLVGDPRQSIYRFRGAEVGLFDEAAAALRTSMEKAENHREVPLNENHRSAPALVHAANGIFAELLPRLTRETSAPMEPPALVPRCGDKPWPRSLHLLAVSNEGLDASAVAEEEARATANIIASLLQAPEHWARDVWGSSPPEDLPVRPGDVAILLRQGTHLTAFEHALRERGIPFHVTGGAGLAARQEVWDLGHLLRFLAEPADDAALLGLLRTPWMGWSDDLLVKATLLTSGLEMRRAPSLWDRIRHVRRAEHHGVSFTDAEWRCVEATRDQLRQAQVHALHATPAEVVEGLLTATGAWGLVRLERDGERRLANLRRALERVRRLGGVHGSEAMSAAAEDLMRLIERERGESEEQLALERGDAVLLMTIHAAKGLEFPVVILPQLHATPRGGGGDGDWCWDAALGFGVCAPDPEDDWEMKPSSAMTLVHRREARESEAEEARLLYVGITRAERMLVLSGAVKGPLENAHESGNRDSKLSWVLDALGVKPGDLAAPEIVPPWPNGEPVPVLTPERVAALAPTMDEQVAAPLIHSITPRDLAQLEPLPDCSDASRAIAIRSLASFAHCPNLHCLEECGDVKAEWFAHGRSSETGTGGGDATLVGSLYHKRVEKWVNAPEMPWREVWELFFREQGESPNADVISRVETLWSQFESMTVFEALESSEERDAEVDVLIDHAAGPLRGRIDLVVCRDRMWEVIDHKTGHERGDDAAIAARHRIQMLCYLLWLRAKAPEQRRFTARIVLPALEREVEVNVEASEMNRVEAEIGELIERFKTQRGRLQPLYPHAACEGCVYAGLPICRVVSRGE